MYCRNLSRFRVYLLVFAQLKLHGGKRIQFQTSSSTQSSQASGKHTASHFQLVSCSSTHTQIDTHMGKQSPVTLKRVTLNYLNDQTESEKRGRARDEMELQRFLNGPEARKDHLLKHFSLAYPNTDTHTRTHPCQPVSLLWTLGVQKKKRCVAKWLLAAQLQEDTFKDAIFMKGRIMCVSVCVCMCVSGGPWSLNICKHCVCVKCDLFFNSLCLGLITRHHLIHRVPVPALHPDK